MPYTPPRETLVTVASRLIFKALVARMVLPHPCVAFHPCMCGLREGAAALIGYDVSGGCCRDGHKRGGDRD
jgi:hypothetical protein